MEFKLDEKSLIEDIRGLLQIQSVNGGCDEGAPLGKGVSDAIDYVVRLGERFGFRGRNIDGYCGYVEMGEGERMVAILNHVDTVPVEGEWSCDPFDGTVRDGRLYGRGACDNKGPALVALYAMKAVADSGLALGKRVRLIVGGDEESGAWKCLRRYKQTEELPESAFSPDADYPVTFAEKGILHILIRRELGPDVPAIELECGKRVNIVPAHASAVVNGKTYEAQGKASHAMAPELGVNALLGLCGRLAADGVDHPFLKLCQMANAEDLGIALCDEPSGKLTINPGVARVDGHTAELRCDIRYPVTAKKEDILARISEAVAPLGFTVEEFQHVGPLYVEKDSKLVTTLQKVYREITGDSREPVSTGGGTYARAFQSAVAFGIFLPGEENMCHKVDEYWSLDSIRTNFQIMANAIKEL
ncbi:Sapep family Mn(2+)-dependent dipeptidase [Harryflintia acetispora]|uniref:Sapep family Mn(2+)-dependent dipeptidase n=1 Tax=Harryflintia acetispora TaxID=1849041 RepID=UPI001898E33A|nr:Sapep family Mn(2+)-dependent dipeptidase [Harryflintia acetispora]